MKEWNGENIKQYILEKGDLCLYLYTPLCGTCQVASRMLMVVEEMLPDVQMAKSNANYIEGIAVDYKVESVPCLLLFKRGALMEKIYAFQSVPYLLGTIRDSINKAD
ncbi:thioredoxin family protein [Bacillus sp. 1P06AnD]|uniref:thioredoxin family protein n=1 Tax=Bacillus sp. 1P06AnD TaxID=3132208 RepID=UPI0039A0F1B0